MRITCTTTFLDGRDRFEAGETRVVDDERGARFVANGWATADGDAPADGGAAPAAEVTLDIKNVTHKTEVIHG